ASLIPISATPAVMAAGPAVAVLDHPVAPGSISPTVVPVQHPALHVESAGAIAPPAQPAPPALPAEPDLIAAAIQVAPVSTDQGTPQREGEPAAESTADGRNYDHRPTRRPFSGAFVAALHREPRDAGQPPRPDKSPAARRPVESNQGQSGEAVSALREPRRQERATPHVAGEPGLTVPPPDAAATSAPRARIDADAMLRSESGSGRPAGSQALRDHLEARPARSSEFVTVSFLDGSESGGRVRLSMRGDALRATILTSEKTLIERLEPRVDALRRSLAEQGFEQPLVTLRAIPSGEGGQATQDQGARRDRGGDPRYRDTHDGRDRHDDAPHEGGRRQRRDTRKER
ncbi:MAG: hypothetical protein AAB011_14615, partial [Candidatus Eisenbacteria bacterium]